jgi:hypothetical protein
MSNSEAVLLSNVAHELLVASEKLPEGSTHINFLKETARKLFQDVVHHLSPPVVSAHVPTPAPAQHPPSPPSQEAQSIASYTKRDFSRWCKSLGLPNGHQFFTVGGGQSKVCFKLVWSGAKAVLEATCPDGVILRGHSPNGILKAYLKKTTGKELNVDGWRRLSMRTPDGLSQWQIRDPEWEKYQWIGGKFVKED